MMSSSGSRSRVRAHSWLALGALCVLSLVVLSVYSVLAAPPGNEHFQRTWERTDKPVLDGLVARTWMWGPEANTNVLNEPYAESPGGQRTVQYYDKARMEITYPNGDATSIWYVTNGLLVTEMITGNIQTGDVERDPHGLPAMINVAGDADDPAAPTYYTFRALRGAVDSRVGGQIIERVNREGDVTADPALAEQNVTVGFWDDVTGHNIAAPFWDFMNSSGAVYQDGQSLTAPLFENPYFATGRPITEAYWANVKVAGSYRDVLMQCFERRCLTYTPGNPDGFVVEAGNVGQHYYQWRYGQTPGEPTPTATATASPTATATSTATATATEAPVTEYEFADEWGEAYTPGPTFDRPRGVAIDGSDNLWVVDFDTHQLVKFDEHGRFLRVVGSQGSLTGQFNRPADVAASEDGRIYVADQDNDRVQVFDAEGTFLTTWGTPGNGDSQFIRPNGIAIIGDRVYVSDLGNNRVQIFNLEGVFQGKFGSKGTSDSQFDGVANIAFDPQGNVYVSDFYNGRVQKFTSAGVFLGQIGTEGSGDGQLDGPSGVAIDAQGNLYVADFYNSRIQKFGPDGSFLAKWGTQGEGFGQVWDPIGLALDSLGNVYVADAANERIDKFTPEGAFMFEVHDASRGRFGTLIGIALDQDGNLLTIDILKDLYEPGSISRYSPAGIPLDGLSWTRPEAGMYDILAGVAVNLENGDIYVTDRISNRVQRFSSTWQYLGKWGTTGNAPAQFNGPTAIAVDADGNVYVADTVNNRVQKFDANGVFLDQWGGVGDGDGQFQQPSGITVEGERVYVSDNGNDRVQVFDREGTYLDQWGVTGTQPGEMDGPVGLAMNPNGNLLVVDSGNNRVQLFTPDGDLLGSFGTAGGGAGQFNLPYGLAVDDDGYVYVIDILNDRVQKFSPAT